MKTGNESRNILRTQDTPTIGTTKGLVPYLQDNLTRSSIPIGTFTLKMLRSVLALAVAFGLASPAMADGFYLNPEYNGSFSGEGYLGATLEPHVGYENGAWYIQGGPALLDGPSDSKWGVTGKTGISIPVDSQTDMYGEASFSKFPDVDTNYGVKMGLKIDI